MEAIPRVGRQSSTSWNSWAQFSKFTKVIPKPLSRVVESVVRMCHLGGSLFKRAPQIIRSAKVALRRTSKWKLRNAHWNAFVPTVFAFIIHMVLFLYFFIVRLIKRKKTASYDVEAPIAEL